MTKKTFHFESSIWEEDHGDGPIWFWIVDKIYSDREETAASGIAKSKEQAEIKVKEVTDE